MTSATLFLSKEAAPLHLQEQCSCCYETAIYRESSCAHSVTDPPFVQVADRPPVESELFTPLHGLHLSTCMHCAVEATLIVLTLSFTGFSLQILQIKRYSK